MVEESPEAAQFISAAYQQWGTPVHRFHLYESRIGPVRAVLLFSDRSGTVGRRKVSRWGLDYLLSEEERLVAKMKTKRGRQSIQADLSKTMENLASMDPLLPWLSQGMSETHILIPETERKMKVRLPSTLVMPEGEVRADLRALQRIACPEGLSAAQKASTLPLRFLRYVVANLTPAGSTVLDVGDSGDLSHAVMELNEVSPSRSCFTWRGVDELICDRLESLTLGAWKDWTYHDPTVPGFTVVSSMTP